MEYYNTISRGYEELYGEEQRRKISVIRDNILFNENDKVLDVGCGPGFADFGCDMYRIDPSEELLKMAKGKKVKGVAEALPFEDDCFDKVISITAMQNFSDIRKAVLEMKRVCKGEFALSFLKKSQKRRDIEEIIFEEFDVKKLIDEEKDIIIIANYK